MALIDNPRTDSYTGVNIIMKQILLIDLALGIGALLLFLVPVLCVPVFIAIYLWIRKEDKKPQTKDYY